MDKKTAWSYSALKTFEQCARQYYYVNFLKKYKSPQNSAPLVFGRAVHEAIEKYCKEGKELPKEFKKFQTFVDAAVKVGKDADKVIIEEKMGLNDKLKPTGFFEKDVWWRGAPDYVAIKGDTAWVADWKTSKSSEYADPDQLELLAMAIFLHHKEVKRVKGALMFLVAKDLVKETYHRKDIKEIVSKWIGRSSKIDEAKKNNVWNPKQSPLCKFCPVGKKDCDYAP